MSGGKNEVNVIIKALDETIPGFKSARTHVKSFADEAKGLIAEAFAGFTVFEFFKTAMEKAIASEEAYAQLSNTLANVGVNYETNRGKIDETIKSLQKVANVRTDDAIKGFNTLVQRSGDYQGSLKNMVLTADLAKAKHLEFNDAAELVGRVMGGNTRVLKQFGIVTKDSTEGLKLLQDRLGGAAAVDMATFGGQIEATKIKFLNLAEEIGDVITGSSTLGGGMSDLRDDIQQVTDWVEKNRAALVFWVSVGVASIKELGRQFVDLVTVAYQTGTMLGKVLSLSWGNPGDKEKREQLYKDIETANRLGKQSVEDMIGGQDRLTVAIADATERREAIQTESASRLKANAARNADELAKRRATEAEARLKEEEKATADRHRRAMDRIKDLEETGQSTAGYHGALTKLFQMEQALAKVIGDGTTSLHARRLAQEEYNAALKARNALEARDPAGLGAINKGLDRKNQGAAAAELPGSEADLANKKNDFNSIVAGIGIQAKQGALVTQASVPAMGFMDALNKKWDEHQKKVAETGEAYKTFGSVLADAVSGPIAQFGEATAEAMGAMIVGSKNAGQALQKAFVGALASVSKLEGDHYAAMAVGDTAIQDYWAAGRHAAAAALMYAVSGAAGALGGSGGGGGGGGGAGQVGVTTSNSLTADKGKLTVMWPSTSKSVLDLTNADDQQLIKDFITKLAGNRDIDFQFASG